MNQNIKPFIPFSRPVLGPREEDAVLRVMRSGWLTTGPEAFEFEKEFAAVTASEHALAVNSATAGLHLALEALGVGPGDVCAVPDYTFTATAEVVRYLGADLVFIDSQPDSANFDLARLESALKQQKIKVVIPVHLAGEPVDWIGLKALQEKFEFLIVEDAAHIFPARDSQGYWGARGDIGVFSFYANKNITTGEGGMIVTPNPSWAARMKVMRLHGIDRDAFSRFTSTTASWQYAVVAPGFKYNMTDLAAAIGRVQLSRADEFWRARQRLARLYLEGLSPITNLVLPRWRDDHAWHVFSILVPENRDGIASTLNAEGIGTSVHYIPLHRMPYWSERYHLKPEHFPRAEARYSKTISLPLYPSLSDDDVHRIIQTLRRVMGLS